MIPEEKQIEKLTTVSAAGLFAEAISAECMMVNLSVLYLNFKRRKSMTSSYYKLDISSRTDHKSRGSKDLRKSGFVPGVLYYAGEESVNISIERSVLFQAMQSGQRIFEIDQSGEKPIYHD